MLGYAGVGFFFLAFFLHSAERRTNSGGKCLKTPLSNSYTNALLPPIAPIQRTPQPPPPLSNVTAAASSITSHFPATQKCPFPDFLGQQRHDRPLFPDGKSRRNDCDLVAENGQRETQRRAEKKSFFRGALTPSEVLGDENTFFRESSAIGCHKSAESTRGKRTTLLALAFDLF